MRTSRVVAKLSQGDMVRMCALGHYLPFFIHYAAHFNYDVVWLDLEHRAMDQREIQSLLALSHLADIDCMIRPPTIERSRLYRYLEDGATGFMFPFVSDAKIAKELVDAVKFPPLGNRGLDGAGLDADYGLSAWKPQSTYTSDANAQSFIAVQIETLEAVSNVEEIAAVPGIDCLFIGPADLRLRIDAAGDGAGINLADAVERVAAAARQHNKAWGIWPNSADELLHYRQMGAQVMPWGDDFGLVQVLETCSQEIERVNSSV